MRESQAYRQEPPRTRVRRARSSFGNEGLPALLASRWRPMLLVAAGLMVVLSLLTQVGRSPSAGQAPAPAPSTVSGPAKEAARPAGLPSPTALSQAVPPAPSPRPSTVRPLSGPPMPKLKSGGPAPVRKQGSPDPQPSTDRFVVVDGASGAVLFEKNSGEIVAPASLTKMMTAVLGIEHGKIEDYPKIDVNARDFLDSTVMGLEPGLNVTLEDILYGLMLPSGNDAAVAIARYVAGNEHDFIQLMNEKAAWLGLKSTHFANPHGLDASDHYSSPWDMVEIARYGMQYPVFQQLSAAKTYNIRRSNFSYTLQNLNPILWSYPGADGVKIGFTDNAGRAIVASATRGGHQVFVGFMRSRAGLAPDATHLLDWAFGYHTWP